MSTHFLDYKNRIFDLRAAEKGAREEKEKAALKGDKKGEKRREISEENEDKVLDLFIVTEKGTSKSDLLTKLKLPEKLYSKHTTYVKGEQHYVNKTESDGISVYRKTCY